MVEGRKLGVVEGEEAGSLRRGGMVYKSNGFLRYKIRL